MAIRIEVSGHHEEPAYRAARCVAQYRTWQRFQISSKKELGGTILLSTMCRQTSKHDQVESRMSKRERQPFHLGPEIGTAPQVPEVSMLGQTHDR